MTYTAPRFTFHGDTARDCPTGYRDRTTGETHKLIRDRDATGEVIPNRWVCPLELDQERAEAYREQLEAEAAAEREVHQRARAEEIAAEIETAAEHEHRDPREWLILAALTGLQEATA